MSLIIPMGHVDVRLTKYDVNGECRTVVKINGIKIVESADGSWVIFDGSDRREFALLGQAIEAADSLSLARSIEI